MWVMMALLSALFAGATAILSKMGVRDTDSTVATAIRTTLVLVFAWLLVFAQGLQAQLWQLSARTYLFLALSGLCTGASWLCYFHALKLGTVNQVHARRQELHGADDAPGLASFGRTDHLAQGRGHGGDYGGHAPDDRAPT